MEFRNTNESTGTSEIRRRVGLQFFADGEGAEDAADMDEAADSGFLNGLTGDDAENQRDDAADTQEDAPEDAGDQRGDGQDEVAETQEDQNTEETETPEDTQETPPEMATLTVNGNQIQVPAAAVGSLAEALGTDTASIGALLQKGMNYERKGADEMRILGEYAKAAGVDLKTYIRGLDNGLCEHKLAQEKGGTQDVYQNTAASTMHWLIKGCSFAGANIYVNGATISVSSTVANAYLAIQAYHNLFSQTIS